MQMYFNFREEMYGFRQCGLRNEEAKHCTLYVAFQYTVKETS